MTRLAAPAAALALLAAAPALAQSNQPPAHYANVQLADPAREAAARDLMHELRCVTCQGQSIADSDAEMAGDMRALVRQRIDRGESAADVRAALIRSYGDYITYDPPWRGATVALWLAPLALLAFGALIATRSFKRRRR